MPLPQKWNSKNRKPPPGFEYVEPVLEALENELRDKVKESNLNKRKTESIWPIHQINWQKSRYIYDLFYTHQKISKQVYQYCLDQKIVDAALIAKWKKKGYERLCSTYVINPSNYKFGTTSICRVPWFDRSEEQKKAQDPTVRISSQTIILNTKSNLLSLSRRDAEDVLLGRGLGLEIFFGNKYGQNLAAVQVAREKRLELKRKQEEERKARELEQKKIAGEYETDDDDGDAETDSESEDDYGPTPTAGIWAGSQKLEKESERLADPDGEAETDDEYEDENEERPSKKTRAD